jgi:polyisoprenoid-binding protein YceI
MNDQSGRREVTPVRERARRHWKGLLAAGIVIIAALAVGIPFLYIHVIEGSQPAALTLNDAPQGTASAGSGGTTTTGGVSGTWTVGTGSQAGYRVHETLAGQSAIAVGRTSEVTGSMTIKGTTVTAETFTVQMASVKSDRSQRDAQFAGRIMDTAQFPTGSFVLTKPIALGTIPPIGKTVTVTATGNLTLHGTTKPVTFTMTADRTATDINVTGDITISYGDYGIDNPSFGGFVSVGSSGTVEFLLVTTKS